MARNRIRTDLGLVAAVLTYTQTNTNYAAAKKYGVQVTTIRRWQLRQMREPTGWPTPTDVDEWRRDAHQNARNRARRAAQVAAYRNRTHLQRGPLWVDSVGTVRRLRALIALGWTQADISPHLGTSPQYVSLLTRGRHPKVHIDTHTAVAAVYDRLCMTIPTHRPAWVHDRQKRYAQNRGWLPPLMFDEGQIDNPAFYRRGPRRKAA